VTLRRYCGQDRTVLSYLIADIRECRIGGNLSHWLIANSPGQSLFPGKFVPSVTITAMQPETGRQVAVALYVVAMVAVIVGGDFARRVRSWAWPSSCAEICASNEA
jgi:hypothetical protein